MIESKKSSVKIREPKIRVVRTYDNPVDEFNLLLEQREEVLRFRGDYYKEMFKRLGLSPE